MKTKPPKSEKSKKPSKNKRKAPIKQRALKKTIKAIDPENIDDTIKENILKELTPWLIENKITDHAKVDFIIRVFLGESATRAWMKAHNYTDDLYYTAANAASMFLKDINFSELINILGFGFVELTETLKILKQKNITEYTRILMKLNKLDTPASPNIAITLNPILKYPEYDEYTEV